MKKIIKWFKLTLYRLFVNPCHRCVREGNCELFNKRGFCGDYGICWYEEKDFEEISKASADWDCYCISSTKWGYVTHDVSRTLAELKKKYTEEET